MAGPDVEGHKLVLENIPHATREIGCHLLKEYRTATVGKISVCQDLSELLVHEMLDFIGRFWINPQIDTIGVVNLVMEPSRPQNSRPRQEQCNDDPVSLLDLLNSLLSGLIKFEHHFIVHTLDPDVFSFKLLFRSEIFALLAPVVEPVVETNSNCATLVQFLLEPLRPDPKNRYLLSLLHLHLCHFKALLTFTDSKATQQKSKVELNFSQSAQLDASSEII